MRHDLRVALRLLARNRSFAAAAILTLALGIGANTAVFSVVNGVLLRPAPFKDLDRLVLVWETDRNTSTTHEPASVPDYLDFRDRGRSVQPLAALMAAEANLTSTSGDPVRLAALRVTGELLPMLGVEPIAGRAFTPEDASPGGPDVALISEALWRQAFAANPAAIGESLRLDDRPYTILGVLPDSTDFSVLQLLSAADYSRGFADRGDDAQVAVWLPLRPDPRALPRETHPIFMLGRLASNQTVASAQAELAGIASELERAYPVNRGRGVNVEPLSEVVFGRVRPTLNVLLGAVALVLLVACVNVASLLLARGTARTQEVAVRRALGASRGRLLGQFLVESLLLTGVAAVAGIALAYAGVRAMIALAPAGVPRLTLVTLDRPVLAATLTVSVLVGLLFGLIPTIQQRGVDLNTTLKDDGSLRTTGGAGHTRVRGALVVGELALAIVLLAGAGLLMRSFWNLLQVDPGFRPEGVLKAEYQLPATRYPVNFRLWPDFKEQHAFTAGLLARAETLPGVVSAAISGNHPLDPGFTNSFTIVGREAEARGEGWPEISVRRVTPGYFRTVDLSVVNGRLLEDRDGTSAAPVLLVNEAAVRRFFPDRDPLGAAIRMYGAARTIVGVVANEKFHGLGEPAPLAIYLPLSQAPSANGAGVLLVRAAGDPLALAPAVRAIVRERDASLAVFGVEPLDVTVSRSVSQRRFAMFLVSLFAGLALLLGAVGIHGVLSYDVARRRREIGIRMALGAQPAGILWLVVGQGLVLTAIALVIGGAGAFALTRVLATLLYGVTPRDPVTLAAVAAVLAIVALAATMIPAWRAARVDPAAALRRG